MATITKNYNDNKVFGNPTYSMWLGGPHDGCGEHFQRIVKK
jgi:hypothetical protein